MPLGIDELGGSGMARREVQIGQRYQPTDSTSVWEVRDMTKDAEGIAHARLVKAGDPTAVKMISASALNDPRLYRLLPDARVE
jgi:hypothetical protein